MITLQRAHTCLADVGSRLEDTSERCSKGRVCQLARGCQDFGSWLAFWLSWRRLRDMCVLFGRVFFNLSWTC